jgi:phosphonopyruvate decarboxylase
MAGAAVTVALPAGEFVSQLRSFGVDAVTGVPCGHLAGPWALFDQAGQLTPAPSEGAAMALAAGWELGGRHAAVLCQNSGFGNLINPLTSLTQTYGIPVLVVMTLRGWPEPASDEPQHAAMGAATTAILDALGVPYRILDHTNLADVLIGAGLARRARSPFFVLVPRGLITAESSPSDMTRPDAFHHEANGPGEPVDSDPYLTRPAVVAALVGALGDELLVTTTGYLSRQVHHERDRADTFYMQGSMGHAAAIGLGVANAAPGRRTVILDGDGAFLMHLGTGSTIGACGLDHLTHIVIDNGCYESTGSQPTTSASVNWTALGTALGYRTTLAVTAPEMLDAAIATALGAPGPVLCALRVQPTPGEIHPRATAAIAPPAITERFSAAVAGGAR